MHLVVVNFNGGKLLQRCVASIMQTRWPRERLRVTVVDNGSWDGSAERVHEHFPSVRMIEARQNLGFGGGNNVVLRDLGECEYVALINNDAFVEPDWLEPLVSALTADPGLGAVCPKILFADRFAQLSLVTSTFTPGWGDRRRLGLRLSGAEVDGRDCWSDVQFVRGWYGWEPDREGEVLCQWSGPEAALRLPRRERGPEQARLRVSAERPKQLRVRSEFFDQTVLIGDEPTWIQAPLDGSALDVIHNAGSVALRGGHGGDRGFLEVDCGQWDRSDEVFAWCGCAVLLRRAYLEDVGLFDARLHLYYEDFDLSWRGRRRGWRYRYVPAAVVRHVRTASSVEGSAQFQHHVERSRLIVNLKNAPARCAAYAILRYLGGTAFYAFRDVLSPLLRREHARPRRVIGRLRTFGTVILELPGVLHERRRLGSTR